MTNKTFDCVKMKWDLQNKLLLDSKAKNLGELVSYINKAATKSDLYRGYLKTKSAVG